MTAPDMMVVESDEEEEQETAPYQPPIETDIFDEYRSMLKEVEDAHRIVKSGTDDLAEIKRMIRKTKNNINLHIGTVDTLKNSLSTINERSKDVLANKKPEEWAGNEYYKKKNGLVKN